MNSHGVFYGSHPLYHRRYDKTFEVQEPFPVAPGQAKQNHTRSTIRQSIFWVSLPFGILSFHLPIYSKGIGADAMQIGLFYSAFFLITVLLCPVVGAGVDRFGRLRPEHDRGRLRPIGCGASC